MLRRSLQKLNLDLEAAIQRAEILSSIPNAKQTKKATTSTVKPAKQPELDRVVERAVWMKAVLNPRAYEAFSQLTADRQFAQLGLVLIGVLAQVEATMTPFVPVEPPPPPPSLRKPQPEETLRSVRVTQGDIDISTTVADAGDVVDLGVAISRDELEGETSVRPSVEPSSSMKEYHDTDRRKGKKRKKSRIETTEARNEMSGLPSEATEKRQKPPAGDLKLKSTKPETMVEELKEVKKYKKAKLDASPSQMEKDELNTKTLDEAKAVKKTKKKKKKGGDEFDDLFSSLL